MTTTLIFMTMAANAFDDAFKKGVEAYQAREYATAVKEFEQLVDQHVVSPAVFYNLGNAYYRAGLLGPAIANYERALLLDPNFSNAEENLTRCVNDTERHLLKPRPSEWEQSLLFWHYGFSFRATFAVTGLLWFAAWTLLGIRQIRPLPYLRRSAAATGVLALAFGTSLWVKSHPIALAVASGERAAVHYGRSDDETVRFELYEGDRVQVDERRGGWTLVQTAEGERGWTRTEGLTFVGPPYEAPAPHFLESIENEE